MKTLVVNGATTRSGDTFALTEEFLRYLDGEKMLVSPHFDPVSPCVDCRHCWKNEGCGKNDGMQPVYTFLSECDHVALASPIWFSEVSGPMLNFISRLQSVYAAKRFLGKTMYPNLKHGVILLAGGGDKGSEKRARQTMRTALRLMNADVAAEVYALQTDAVPAKQDEEALEQAREAALLLGRLHGAK